MEFFEGTRAVKGKAKTLDELRAAYATGTESVVEGIEYVQTKKDLSDFIKTLACDDNEVRALRHMLVGLAVGTLPSKERDNTYIAGVKAELPFKISGQEMEFGLNALTNFVMSTELGILQQMEKDDFYPLSEMPEVPFYVPGQRAAAISDLDKEVFDMELEVVKNYSGHDIRRVVKEPQKLSRSQLKYERKANRVDLNYSKLKEQGALRRAACLKDLSDEGYSEQVVGTYSKTWVKVYFHSVSSKVNGEMNVYFTTDKSKKGDIRLLREMEEFLARSQQVQKERFRATRVYYKLLAQTVGRGTYALNTEVYVYAEDRYKCFRDEDACIEIKRKDQPSQFAGQNANRTRFVARGETYYFSSLVSYLSYLSVRKRFQASLAQSKENREMSAFKSAVLKMTTMECRQEFDRLAKKGISEEYLPYKLAVLTRRVADLANGTDVLGKVNINVGENVRHPLELHLMYYLKKKDYKECKACGRLVAHLCCVRCGIGAPEEWRGMCLHCVPHKGANISADYITQEEKPRSKRAAYLEQRRLEAQRENAEREN